MTTKVFRELLNGQIPALRIFLKSAQQYRIQIAADPPRQRFDHGLAGPHYILLADRALDRLRRDFPDPVRLGAGQQLIEDRGQRIDIGGHRGRVRKGAHEATIESRAGVTGAIAEDYGARAECGCAGRAAHRAILNR